VGVTGIAAGTATISYSLGAGCTVTATVIIEPLPASITGVTEVLPALYHHISGRCRRRCMEQRQHNHCHNFRNGSCVWQQRRPCNYQLYECGHRLCSYEISYCSGSTADQRGERYVRVQQRSYCN